MNPTMIMSTNVALPVAPRILILDDDPERFIHFHQHLGKGNNVSIVHSSEKAYRALQQSSWDFVFLDHDLGLSIHYYEELDPGSGTILVDAIKSDQPLRDRFQLDATTFIIHSMNAIDGDFMAYNLEALGFPVCRRIAAWMDADDLFLLNREGSWPILRERWDLTHFPPKRANIIQRKRPGYPNGRQQPEPRKLTWEE